VCTQAHRKGNLIVNCFCFTQKFSEVSIVQAYLGERYARKVYFGLQATLIYTVITPEIKLLDSTLK